MKSYIQARQTHQLFVKCVFDFGVVFHIEPGHVFYQFWLPFWLQKSSEMEPEVVRKPSIGFERHFWPSGGLLGPFWGRFWGHLGVDLGLPGACGDFSKKHEKRCTVDDFCGSGGSKKCPRHVPKQLPTATWLQERLGVLLGPILEHFWLHFGSILGPKIGPKPSPKPS